MHAVLSCCNPVPGTGANTGLVLLNNGITGLPLTADQQFQAGFTCAGVRTAPSRFGPARTSYSANQFSWIYLQVPGPGKEKRRSQSATDRSTLSVRRRGWPGQFVPWGSLPLEPALYASSIWPTRPQLPFHLSGTHYATPRTETVELGFHF